MRYILIIIGLIWLSGCCAPMQMQPYQQQPYYAKSYNNNPIGNISSSVSSFNSLLNNIKSLEQTLESF